MINTEKMSKPQQQGTKIHKGATVLEIVVVVSTHTDWVQMSENETGVHKRWMSRLSAFYPIIYVLTYFKSAQLFDWDKLSYLDQMVEKYVLRPRYPI